MKSLSPAPLVELQQICKHYTSGQNVVKALDGVDLTIRQGEFLAILGPRDRVNQPDERTGLFG